MQELLLSNSFFAQIISELHNQGSICRKDPRLVNLSIEAKYCLIRLKSDKTLLFENDRIVINSDVLSEFVVSERAVA